MTDAEKQEAKALAETWDEGDVSSYEPGRVAARRLARAFLSLLADQEGRGAGGWQPIETAPKDGHPVHVFWRDEYGLDVIDVHACAVWREFGDGSRGWVGESFHASDPTFWTRLIGEHPTHWRPLPPPPVKGQS